MHAVKRLLLLVLIVFISPLSAYIPDLTAEEKEYVKQHPNIKAQFSSEKGIKFTTEESEYLASIKEIKICVNPDILPLEGIDRNKKHVGVGAEIMNLISESLQKSIVLVPTKNWKETLKYFKEEKCDILPMAINTPNRQKEMSFTKPYVKDSIVVVTKADQFFILDSSELEGHKVGVVSGYAFVKTLKEKNPTIDLVSVKSAKEGLQKVQNNEIFAYVDALSRVAYIIQKNGMRDLKVTGKLEFDIKLSLAVRKDKPLLVTVIEKSINEIGEEKIRSIVGNWVSINVKAPVDYTKLMYVTFFFLFIFMVIFYKNRAVNKINKALEASNKQIEEKNKLLKELSIRDHLTQLYNRNKLDSVLAHEANVANRYGNSFGVIMIDIDFFKSVNDIYGHQMGDSVLREFTDILQSSSRKTDIIGRWGGEEFLIICCEANLDGTLTFAEKLKEKVASFPFIIGEQKTASFGVSTYKKNESIQSLIKRADDALYEAKKKGRNRVEII